MIYLISMRPLPKNKVGQGQTLINLLVAIALFAILSQALFTLISASYAIVAYTRARTGAQNIAVQKIEEIRNMPYDDVGTEGGIPAGSLQQMEYYELNGLRYLIKTGVIYIDDPFDGIAPIDLLPTDYKRVRVDVSWGGISDSSYKPVTIVTDIAPRGVESTAGGGTLSIIVFDANTMPVAQAQVTVIASSVSPQVNLTLETSDDGRVILPGAPVCTTPCYQITVTKDGYSTERTYSTDEVANPNKPNLSVLEGDLTEVGFAIDRTGTLNVSSFANEENNFYPVGNTSFYVRGDKTIGTNTQDDPVYKYTNLFTTNTSGRITITDLEWDNYQVFVGVSDGYDISATKPFLPINMLPRETVDFSFTVSPHTQNTALISFSDLDNNPIASVSALLYDGSGFEATASSGLEENPNFGQVFFSDLQAKIYHLEATASGFIKYTGNLDVIGNKQESVILNDE